MPPKSKDATIANQPSFLPDMQARATKGKPTARARRGAGNNRERVLVPLHLENCAVSLARGYFWNTNDEMATPDVQRSGNGRLLAFKNAVPAWAVDACGHDAGRSAVCVLEISMVECEEEGSGLASIQAPLAASRVSAIHFFSKEARENFDASLSGFPDVPLQLFEKSVTPQVFASMDPAGEATADYPLGNCVIAAEGELAGRKMLDRVAGLIAVAVHEWIEDGKSGKAGVYPINVLTVSAEAKTSEAWALDTLLGTIPEDRSPEADIHILASAIDAICEQEPGRGFDPSSLLALIGQKAIRRATAEPVKAEIMAWEEYTHRVLRGEVGEFTLDDEGRIPRRAVVALLLGRDLNGVSALVAEVNVGRRVGLVGSLLVGFSSGFAGLPVSFKGEGRQNYNALVDLALACWRGKNSSVSASTVQIGPDYSEYSSLKGHTGELAMTRVPPADAILRLAKGLRELGVKLAPPSEGGSLELLDINHGEPPEMLAIVSLTGELRDRLHIFSPVAPNTAKVLGKASQWMGLLEDASASGCSLALCEYAGQRWCGAKVEYAASTLDMREVRIFLERVRALRAAISFSAEIAYAGPVPRSQSRSKRAKDAKPA